jgi:hypothetical protein
VSYSPLTLAPPAAGAGRPGPGGGQVQGDVDDHVLLAADQAAAADLHEDVARVDAVGDGGTLGVAQEAGVHTGVAEGEGLAVDLDGTVQQRPDQVVGGVLESEQVAVVLPALKAGDRDKRLDRAVAGAGAEAGQRRVDPGDAVLDGHDGVGDREGQVLVGVDAQFGHRVQQVPVGADPVPHAVHGQAAAGVSDVDAVRAVGLHQPGLLGQRPGRGHVAHHQKTGHVHAQVPGLGDVLGGNVGLGGVRGDPDRGDPEIVGPFEVLDGADAGQQQGGQPGALHYRGDGTDPFLVGVGAGPVGEAGARQPVAVGDLDSVDARGVQGSGDGRDLVQGEPVADGVHAVPQGHVLDVDLRSGDVRDAGHRLASAGWAPGRWARAARRSPARSAADVMMSRFPA